MNAGQSRSLPRFHCVVSDEPCPLLADHFRVYVGEFVDAAPIGLETGLEFKTAGIELGGVCDEIDLREIVGEAQLHACQTRLLIHDVDRIGYGSMNLSFHDAPFVNTRGLFRSIHVDQRFRKPVPNQSRMARMSDSSMIMTSSPSTFTSVPA